MKSKFWQVFTIAMAYIGVIVGAGYASGQEVLQHFVSFGKWGIVGAVLSILLFSVTGKSILEMGSYYLAHEHSETLDKVCPKFLSILLDILLIVSSFGIGLVMIAGAGSNLNQQFGLPLWAGSVLLSVLIIICGFLNVDRVTRVIGAITPFLIVFLLGISIQSIATTDTTIGKMDSVAREIDTTLNNWVYSSFNYVGMNLMTGFAMAVVMGGNEVNIKTAKNAGLLGGLMCGIMIVLSAWALLLNVEVIGQSDMPLLELINNISPILGVCMSVIIFGMIFNTGTGVFYGLAARLSKNKPKRFPLIVTISVILGYGCSLFGFTNLIAYVYPIIGLAGIILMLVLFYVDIKYKKEFKAERKRRDEIFALKVEEKEENVSKEKEIKRLADKSPVEEKEELLKKIDEVVNEG